MKDTTKVMTIEDVNKLSKILQEQGMASYKPVKLYFSQRQVDLMQQQGEDVNLDKMTINDHPFEILEDPFENEYQGLSLRHQCRRDSLLDRLLKEFENAPTKKAPQ
jgi:hypothetical protein